jgi:hypothetical protein
MRLRKVPVPVLERGNGAAALLLPIVPAVFGGALHDVDAGSVLGVARRQGTTRSGRGAAAGPDHLARPAPLLPVVSGLPDDRLRRPARNDLAGRRELGRFHGPDPVRRLAHMLSLPPQVVRAAERRPPAHSGSVLGSPSLFLVPINCDGFVFV